MVFSLWKGRIQIISCKGERSSRQPIKVQSCQSSTESSNCRSVSSLSDVDPSANITAVWSSDHRSGVHGVSGCDVAADTHQLLKQMASHNSAHNDIVTMSLEVHVCTRGLCPPLPSQMQSGCSQWRSKIRFFSSDVLITVAKLYNEMKWQIALKICKVTTVIFNCTLRVCGSASLHECSMSLRPR